MSDLCNFFILMFKFDLFYSFVPYQLPQCCYCKFLKHIKKNVFINLIKARNIKNKSKIKSLNINYNLNKKNTNIKNKS